MGINSGNLRKTENNLTLGGYIGIKQSSVGGTIKHNNSWNNQFNYENFTPDSTNLSVVPMLVNSNMDSLDFHLQMYSPLIDAGDPNILDKDGSRSDIGLFGGPFGEKYSYKDLAPLAPRNLSAVVDTSYITLNWNRSTEADTAYYRVYRDTVINFQKDSTKLISSQSDTNFVQSNPHRHIVNMFIK